MGSCVSKETAEIPAILNLDSNRHYRTELTSYLEECQLDTDLQAFDSTLHARTRHVINKLAGGVEVRALSLNSLREVTACLMDMNQEVVNVVLECKEDIWKTKELFNLVQEYFKNSLQTLDFCTELEKCLKRVKDNQMLLMVALQQFDDEEALGETKFKRTLEDLKNFKAAADPFTAEFFQFFQSICKQQSSTLEKLQKRQIKLDKKLKKIHAWRKVSKIIFYSTYAAVLICSVVAAAIAVPPVAAALAATSALPMKSVAKWIDSMWKSYENVLVRQNEVISAMQVGTCVTIMELQNIRKLIDRLEKDIEARVSKADVDISQEALRFGIDEIKKRLSGFMKNVEELGSEADACSRYIRRARTVILKRIIKPSSD